MAMLGLGDYLCEACRNFDSDGNDGNHPVCCKQHVIAGDHRAIRLGEECPYGYEFGVPDGYPVSRERNKKRAYEIKAKLDELEDQARQRQTMKALEQAEFEAQKLLIDHYKIENEDLKGMLGELPPEGKCAMLLVQHVDGEYVWACEKYDFASYRIVDVEADSCTGMTLNDPFGRADSGDKLTMAKMLRQSAAELEGQGDALGVIDMQRERIAELEAEVERWRGRAEMLEGYIEGPQGWRASCDAYEALVRDLWKGHDCGAGCAMYDGCHHPTEDRCTMEERMAELGIEVER